MSVEAEHAVRGSTRESPCSTIHRPRYRNVTNVTNVSTVKNLKGMVTRYFTSRKLFLVSNQRRQGDKTLENAAQQTCRLSAAGNNSQSTGRAESGTVRPGLRDVDGECLGPLARRAD